MRCLPRWLLFCLILALGFALSPILADASQGYGGLGTAPNVRLGRQLESSHLACIVVGNQAGVLAVMSRDRQTALFTKDAPNSTMTGIDSTEFAPIHERHRRAIFAALGIGGDELDGVARALIAQWRFLRKREGVALLGVIGSEPGARLSPAARLEIRQFLAGLLRSDEDVRVRRQAFLALALSAEMDRQTVDAVLGLLETSHNSWETFPAQQFFRYQRRFVGAQPDFAAVVARIERSGSPYVDRILAALAVRSVVNRR